MKSFDYETYLILPGLVTPKPVVMSVADADRAWLLTPEEGAKFLREAHRTGEILATANGVFDLGVACARDPDLLPLVFEMLERGQIKDTHLRQPLLDIGRGTLLQGADGVGLKSYSLQNIAEKVLGIFVAKENTPRLEYAHLDGVPFNLWTEEQREYSRKDARVTYDVVKTQSEGEEGDPGLLNLLLEDHETRAMWALHLMSAWGPRTDPEMVADVTRQVTEAHEAAIARFTEAGIYRGEGWCRREKHCEGSEPHRLDQRTDQGRALNGNLLPVGRCWKEWLPSKVGTRDGAWLQELVTRAYQGKPPPTESGGVSTDRDTLTQSGDELLMALGDAGANETDYKTYLDVIARGVEVPICVRYDPIKKTARVGARNPNLQNLPRGGRSRECFVPRDFRHPDPCIRKVYCSTDFPGLELWTLGETLLDMFGGSVLAESLKRGDDMHTRLAGVIKRMPYEEALRRKKADDKEIVDFRQSCKPVNYGLGGGMSDEALVLYCRQPSNGGVRLCLALGADKCGKEKIIGEKGKAEGKPLCKACVEAAAETFIPAWHEMLPEMRDFFKEVKKEVDSGFPIEVLGPEGLPDMYCADRSFNAAANLKFQGRAARLAKDALWRIARASYYDTRSPMHGCRPVMFVHDELISELPEVLADGAAWEQARLMGEAFKAWCPKIFSKFAVPEPALCRRWFKKAEKVFDARGKLIPWWPKDWKWGPDLQLMQADLKRKAK